MFGALGNLPSIMKQVQQLRGRIESLGEELRAKRAIGTAGAGMVDVEINGAMEILRCTIDPALVAQGDRELIEDLVVGAANQAIAKARELHADAVQSLSGGFDVPGLGQAMSSILGDSVLRPSGDTPADEPNDGEQKP